MEYLGWWKRIRVWVAPPAPASAAGEALLQAARRGDAVAANALLAVGTPPDEVRTRNRETALWVAARHGHVDVAEGLLAVGADPGADDDTGVTPLIRAAIGGHHAIIELMAVARPQAFHAPTAPEALRRAALNGHEAAICALLRGGVRPDSRSGGFPTALLAAAVGNHAPCIEQLLAAGADPQEVDLTGRTALHLAAATGDEASVSVLLAGGADARARSRAGLTPWDEALTDGVRRLLAPRPPVAPGPLVTTAETHSPPPDPPSTPSRRKRNDKA